MAGPYDSVLGPLTSIFTPPSTCITGITYVPPLIESSTAALYRGASGDSVADECYPSGFTTDFAYSPGVCPSGWTSACNVRAHSGTTGIQCCPTSMSCSYFDVTDSTADWAWCHEQSTDTSRVVWSLTKDGFGLYSSLVTTPFPSLEVRAKPIFLAYQAKDQALLASITAPPFLTSSSSTATTSESKTTSESTTAQISEEGSTTTTTTTSASTSATTGNPHRLSTGAKAGIGIGAVVSALILIGATFFFRRICGYRRRSGGTGATPVVPPYEEVKHVYSQGHVAPKNAWIEDRDSQGYQGGGFQYRPSASEMDAEYELAQMPELVERPR